MLVTVGVGVGVIEGDGVTPGWRVCVGVIVEVMDGEGVAVGGVPVTVGWLVMDAVGESVKLGVKLGVGVAVRNA